MAEGTAEILVDDQETVCRVSFVADHPISRDGVYSEMYDPETRLIRLEEISLDDLNKSGFSLQRVMLYTQADAHKHAERSNVSKSEKFGRNVNFRVAGGHFFNVSSVHAIENADGKRIFKVLESPMDGQPAHAEILAVEKVTNSQKLKYRKLLRDVLGPLKDVALLDA